MTDQRDCLLSSGVKKSNLTGCVSRHKRSIQAALIAYLIATLAASYFYEGGAVGILITIPAGFALVTFLIFVTINELILSAAFLLDTIRFFLRLLLPKRWSDPICNRITVRWHRSAPNYMKSNVWMLDDRPVRNFKKPS
ncbi:MAG: hypothetical protein ACI84R_002057 [Candidatus Azotimanducaceae bacterium]|jgi:hypothetical protein